MKIRFTARTELDICDTFDEEQDRGQWSQDVFEVGAEHEVDIINEDEEHDAVDIQFGNGSIALGVPNDCIQRCWYAGLDTEQCCTRILIQDSFALSTLKKHANFPVEFHEVYTLEELKNKVEELKGKTK